MPASASLALRFNQNRDPLRFGGADSVYAEWLEEGERGRVEGQFSAEDVLGEPQRRAGELVINAEVVQWSQRAACSHWRVQHGS